MADVQPANQHQLADVLDQRHQRRDSGEEASDDQILFPVPQYRSVGDLGRCGSFDIRLRPERGAVNHGQLVAQGR